MRLYDLLIDPWGRVAVPSSLRRDWWLDSLLWLLGPKSLVYRQFPSEAFIYLSDFYIVLLLKLAFDKDSDQYLTRLKKIDIVSLSRLCSDKDNVSWVTKAN